MNLTEPLILRIDRHHFHFVLGIGTAEFCGKGKVPIGVPELGVAIEQRHRIQGDQFMVLFAEDHGVYFQILRIFVIETGEHLACKLGHLLRRSTSKARILGQPFERLRRRLLSDFHPQALHAIPIRFDFNAAAVGNENVRPFSGRFHRAIIFFLVRNHFGHDHLRDGDAADLATDHFLRRRFRFFQIQTDFDQAKFESRAKRFMSLDHQLGFLEPFIGLTKFCPIRRPR